MTGFLVPSERGKRVRIVENMWLPLFILFLKFISLYNFMYIILGNIIKCSRTLIFKQSGEVFYSISVTP